MVSDKNRLNHMETDSKINFNFYLKLKKGILAILGKTLFKKEVSLILIMLIASYAIARNLIYLTPIIKRNLVFIIDHLSWNYDQKIISAVGEDYYYTGKLINQKVPPGSVMMIPPQMGGWPESGNPEFSQYFFGPARLIRENSNLESQESLTHLLIAWGEGISEDSKYFGWPRFPAKFEKIYHLPLKKEFYLGLPQINGGLARSLDEINYINSSEYYDEKYLDINEKTVFAGQPAQHLVVRYSSTDSDYFWIDQKISNAQINNLTIPIFVVAQNQIPAPKLPTSIQRVKLAVKVKNAAGKSLIFTTNQTKGVNRWEFLKTESFWQQLGSYILRNNLKDKNFQVVAVGLKTSFDPWELYEVRWGVAKLINKDFRQENSQELDSQKEIRAGHALTLSSQKSQALTAYLNSFDLDRTDPWSLYWASQISADDPNKELEYLTSAYRHSPNIPWFSYKLGLKYSDDPEKSLKYFSESLEIDPQAPWTHMGRGEVFEKLGKLKKALEDYEQASELNRYLYSTDAKKARLRREEILRQAQLGLKNLEMTLVNNPFDTSAKFELLKVYHLVGSEQKFKKLFDELNNVLKEDKEFLSFLADFQPKPTEKDSLQPPVVVEDFESEGFNKIEGVKGKAAVFRDKDFISFAAESFSTPTGSIQFFWKPPTIEKGEVVNLLYQFSTKYSQKNGFLLWAGHDYLGFAIYDGEKDHWQEILANSKINWENRWYKITLSYGVAGMQLFLDGKIIGQNSYSGGIGAEFPIFLGYDLIILPFPPPKDKGAFDELVVYNFQIAEDSR